MYGPGIKNPRKDSNLTFISRVNGIETYRHADGSIKKYLNLNYKKPSKDFSICCLASFN